MCIIIPSSVLFFGNSLVGRQWGGAVLVFAGIFLDGAFGSRKQKPVPPSGSVESGRKQSED